ncbi:MAG: Uma2 family endonuclease [Acidobacteria bacterium]|nr:Uma2 family endonuclease [Acidobacteriota bacterium]
MVAPQGTILRSETNDRLVVLPNVSWETYERLLAEIQDSANVRLAYDEGMLEIKMLSAGHERPNRTLALLIEVLAEEMNIDIERLGSTTFKRDDLLKGFEPDSCFYIQNAEAIAGKDSIDLAIDPPPDLVIEVDISSGSLDKFPIFAGVGVPEVWRYDQEKVTFHKLEGAGYVEDEHSLTFPPLTSELATQFLEESVQMKSTAWLRRVREWARAQLISDNQQ